MRNGIFSFWRLALLFAVLVPSSGNAGQVAASVEYRFVARPTTLSGDLQPLPGVSLRFPSIKAIDGYVVDASLWQPEAKQPAETTLVLMVHGSGGDYARAPNGALSRALSASGLASLAINTRQHGEMRNTDNFFDKGSFVTNIKFILLPDAKGANPGGHFFADNVAPPSEAIVSWLGSQR